MSIDKQKLKDGINEDYSRTTTNAPFYDGMRKAYHEILNDIDDGRFNSEVNISSLITTIESQKEEIADLKLQCDSHQNHFLGANDEADVLFKQVESLKAITELAVKGLKEVAEGGYHKTYSYRLLAEDTLSEIAKSSHE